MIDRPREWTAQDLWQRLRRRKVVQWSLAYAAAMWGLLQGFEYFGETFEWSLNVRKLATVAALLGLPIVLVLAWYHGDRGEQRVARSELIVIALLVLIGGTVLWRYEQMAQDVAKSDVSARVAPTASAAPQASVAVLPFAALSSGVDDGYSPTA